MRDIPFQPMHVSTVSCALTKLLPPPFSWRDGLVATTAFWHDGINGIRPSEGDALEYSLPAELCNHAM